MENDPFIDPIIVSETRILRPAELKQLLAGIPKNSYKTSFHALLATGMRYTEFEKFQDNPKWFNESEEKIFLPKTAIRKKKVVNKQRWILLSPFGAMMVSNFLNGKMKVPDRRTWYDNLMRWGKNADMNLEGFGIKMTRKTLECWLFAYYPNNITQILVSLGHTKETAINHYLGMPFIKDDINDMATYIGGWL